MNKPETTPPNFVTMDTYLVPGRGTAHVVKLTEHTTRSEIGALRGTTILIDGKPFRVSGVETPAIEDLSAGSSISLLGEFALP